MAKLGQQMSIGENELAPNGQIRSGNTGERPYTLFRGHCGPAYSATFSPFGDFLLSSSSDSTIRLWSMNFNANLVCYKGHNYPVWDVQFSSLGHYFASASHDWTARIWSVDRIQPLRVMAGPLSDVDCVRGMQIATMWQLDLVTKQCDCGTFRVENALRVFIGHRSMILSLAMSFDGRDMASIDEDGTIMMWDLASGLHFPFGWSQLLHMVTFFQLRRFTFGIWFCRLHSENMGCSGQL